MGGNTSCKTVAKDLDLAPDEDLSDPEIIKDMIAPAFEQYPKEYESYYNAHKRDNSPAMRNPNPVVILYPGVGIFTFPKNKQTARVASAIYINAINVMRGAEAIANEFLLSRQCSRKSTGSTINVDSGITESFAR